MCIRDRSQRYSMPYKEVAGLLTDIGTEELAHLEMVVAIVHQLTRNLSMEEIKESGFDKYYVDHTVGVWPQACLLYTSFTSGCLRKYSAIAMISATPPLSSVPKRVVPSVTIRSCPVYLSLIHI